MAQDIDGYREFVQARLEPLRRLAYLLSGDWHAADDLVSIALVKLLRSWKRVAKVENPDAYVRRVLLRVWLDERRRPWRREYSTEYLPERAAVNATESAADRLTLLALLDELPPRRRAVIVLRYFCDLSVEDTAAELECSIGTVKSQTARGLATLRARLTPDAAVNEKG